MGDSLITIVAIFLAAVLMFMVPLISVSERNDDISQIAVQAAVSEFVDTASQKGKITENDYDSLVQTLGATGNTYDIEIEIQKLDENVGKKTTLTSGNLIGENAYYSEFTSAVFENENYKDGIGYILNKGDNIIVTVKNTNMTMAELFRNFLYKVVGKDTYQVGATYSSMVINTGSSSNN